MEIFWRYNQRIFYALGIIAVCSCAILMAPNQAFSSNGPSLGQTIDYLKRSLAEQPNDLYALRSDNRDYPLLKRVDQVSVSQSRISTTFKTLIQRPKGADWRWHSTETRTIAMRDIERFSIGVGEPLKVRYGNPNGRDCGSAPVYQVRAFCRSNSSCAPLKRECRRNNCITREEGYGFSFYWCELQSARRFVNAITHLLRLQGGGAPTIIDHTESKVDGSQFD